MAHQKDTNQPCDCPFCAMLEELGQPDFVEEDENGFVWTAHRLDDDSGRMMLSMFPPGQLRIADAVGRNQPCPCGSGLKFKKCCGRYN